MRRILSALRGGRLQTVLTIAFALIAAITVGINAFVVSRIIEDYLGKAQDNRVARDMHLAQAFYQFKQEEIDAVGQRMAMDPRVSENLLPATQNQPDAIESIDQEISRKITVPNQGGTHLIAVFDSTGEMLIGRSLLVDGELSAAYSQGDWSQLPILISVFESGENQHGTEIIPQELLKLVDLDQQASIPLVETPKAALEPFDPQEGTAGLAITSVYPLKDGVGQVIGAVLVAYLFNNDFTLVDRIKDAAQVDTVTIFFGDLRVSTNVPDEQGKRAVGTRVSQEVGEIVLEQGLPYIGQAFVVNEPYITRYEPLRDHLDEVVGSIYVGARLSTFEQLVQTIDQRVLMVAVISVLLAALIAIPVTRFISHPISELVEANRLLAKGDTTVRVQTNGKGELAILGHTFNSMVATLHETQQELLQKEKLASVGQLAAGVAHEINNPLGTILLFSTALQKDIPKESPFQEDVQIIVDETTRCKNIVADLLNFSRQNEVLSQTTNIHELLEQIIAEKSHHDEFTRVKFICKFEVALPNIQADPAQLKQVFLNLINNAAEAMENGGTITLSTRIVNGQQVEIQIADTGCGIPQENIEKLFVPFFTTKGIGKGTGLGLSIVYGIVKMHRGQISVRSKVGEGSVFTIILPMHLSEFQDR